MTNFTFKNIYFWPLSLRIVFVVLISMLIFAMVYFWHISSLIEKFNATQQTERELKEKLHQTLIKQNKLIIETAQFVYLQSEYNQWQQRIIHHSKLPELLNEILKIGANNHIEISAFNPQKEVKTGAYSKVAINVIAVGSYHQLANFISNIAQLPWIVVINNFTISNENKNSVLGASLAAKASTDNLLTAELTLEVYHSAEQKK